MAYRLKHGDDSVEEGLRRIAREQIEKAIAEIDDDGVAADETVHQIRKRCKKLRALVRLVRPAFDGYAQENARFRDLARRLSGARDDDVLIETFDMLAERAGDKDREEFAGVRERLVARRDANRMRREAETPEGGLLAAAREELREALEQAARWSLSNSGYSALRGGIERTYRRGRKAYRAVRDDPTPENVHEWRKRVKYHGYHTRLLVPLWPPLMKARKREAGRLGDLLGGHHDLSVFSAEFAKDFALAGNAELLETLVRLARERQEELLGEALKLGALLFAERPEVLSKRWRAAWKTWKNE